MLNVDYNVSQSTFIFEKISSDLFLINPFLPFAVRRSLRFIFITIFFFSFSVQMIFTSVSNLFSMGSNCFQNCALNMSPT